MELMLVKVGNKHKIKFEVVNSTSNIRSTLLAGDVTQINSGHGLGSRIGESRIFI